MSAKARSELATSRHAPRSGVCIRRNKLVTRTAVEGGKNEKRPYPFSYCQAMTFRAEVDSTLQLCARVARDNVGVAARVEQRPTMVGADREHLGAVSGAMGCREPPEESKEVSGRELS